jgi:hypothetical protein
MVTVRPHALTHPARPEHMAGQVMSPVRFLYAKALTTQGPCVHQYCGPPLCFLTRLPPIRKSPARPPATAFNLSPNFTPRASDQARYMREARHHRQTTSGANNYLPSRIALLQPPGDGRWLCIQQEVALTTRRTTASTTTTTLTSYKHNISGYSSVPQFTTKLPQLATTPGGGIEGPEICL